MRTDLYFGRAATIGAFATELQLSLDGTRLFFPLRSNASVTWADVDPHDEKPADTVGNDMPDPNYAPFGLDCGQDASGRCGANHSAGNNPNEDGNTRLITMPGEPFGMVRARTARRFW